MTKNILDNQKHQNKLLALIQATVAQQESGVTCYFENASMAISLSQSRTEIISALDKDVKKTATHLRDVLPIINSIKNSIVTELSNTSFNYVDDVFGNTYNKEENSVTLSGVEFSIEEQLTATVGLLSTLIYGNIFGIDKKELSATIKSIALFEKETDSVKKAILYPATIKADEIIARITEEEIKYSDFRNHMSFEDKAAFDVTFKRTGIDGVIQNSTYIDNSGIKQILPQHKGQDANEIAFLMSVGRLKYIDGLEVDGDGDISKALRVINQIERLKINSKVKFTLKFRKLGGYKARGLFMQSQLIVAEDVRDTSALLHEIGHLIHMTNLEDNAFVNNMIARLSPRIDFTNTPEDFQDALTDSKSNYYRDEKEIVARAIEIASLFAQEQSEMILGDDEFMLIKNRAYYEELEGIYFNFTTFSDADKEDMLKLFKLFYQTSPDEVVSTGMDNFYKIDTQYTKEKKELTIQEIIRIEARKQITHQKALYSMVNAENIKTIFDNRGDATELELSASIIANITHCGNHKARMSAKDWSEVVENKAGVVNYILEEVEASLSLKGYIQFLTSLKKSRLWSRIDGSVLLDGFTIPFRKQLRKELELNTSEAFDKLSAFNKSIMNKHPMVLATKDILLDKGFVSQILEHNNVAMRYVDSSKISLELLREYFLTMFNVSKNNVFMPEALKNDIETMDTVIVENPSFVMSAGDEYTNNPEVMQRALAMDKPIQFYNLGEILRDDAEFVAPFIKKDPSLVTYLSLRLQKDPSILGLFDNKKKELDDIKTYSTSQRRKLARTTKSIEILGALAKDRNYEIRAEVAKRDICPISILESLSKLKDTWVKASVAGNQNTPKAILNSIMINCSDDWVLERLATNPTLSFTQLKELSLNSNRNIQWGVMQNKLVQLAILEDSKRNDIVAKCMFNNEEDFHHRFSTCSDFYPNYKFLASFNKEVKEIVVNGYEGAFERLSKKMMEALPSASIDADFETLVEVEQNNTVEVIETIVEEVSIEASTPSIDCEELIHNGDIIDFEHSRTKEQLKVLVIEEKLSKDDFKSFLKYIKENSVGYYSKFAKGFVLSNEYYASLTKSAASIATTLYSAEVLDVFAGGTLF